MVFVASNKPSFAPPNRYSVPLAAATNPGPALAGGMVPVGVIAVHDGMVPEGVIAVHDGSKE